MTTLMSILAQSNVTEDPRTWWDTVQDGGAVGYLILALSTVALALIIMHFVQIRRNALIPPEQLEHLDELLSQGKTSAALEYCYDPEFDSFLTRIVGTGLTRFQKSAFGAFEIKNAIEEAGEDQTARLYRSTDPLGVIGAIAPLMGLLGTVLGMVGAFNTIARVETPKPSDMAGDISLALVTTLMGLILAIPCIALHRYFGNRIDAIAAEASQDVERLILHLESAGTGGSRSGVSPRPKPMVRQGGARPPSPPSGAPPSPQTPAAPGPPGKGAS